MANPYEDRDPIDPFREKPAMRSPTQRYTDPNLSPVDRPPAATFFEDPQPQFLQSNPSDVAGGETNNRSGVGAQPPSSTYKVWTVEFYQEYFDVTTRQVLTRISNTLVPFSPPDFLVDRNWHYNENPGVLNNVRPNVLEESGVVLSDKPDMYGPVWLSTTLWIVIGIVQNTIRKREFDKSHTVQDHWHYHFSGLPTACLMVYIYCFVIAGVLWSVMKWQNLNVNLAGILSLYGYSMFIYLLATVFCMTPWNTLRWIAMSFGACWSTSYLLLNLWHMMRSSLERQWLIGVVSGITILHVLFGMLIKIIFL